MVDLIFNAVILLTVTTAMSWTTQVFLKHGHRGGEQWLMEGGGGEGGKEGGVE